MHNGQQRHATLGLLRFENSCGMAEKTDTRDSPVETPNLGVPESSSWKEDWWKTEMLSLLKKGCGRRHAETLITML